MVIVVGTSHPIQTSDQSLTPFLERLCQEFKVCGIAEEMNAAALSENDQSTTIPMLVVERKLGSSLVIIHRERGWEGCPLRSVLVLSPGEILTLRLTLHPTCYIVGDKALLSSFRGVALI
jgi:hypothetical protein